MNTFRIFTTSLIQGQIQIGKNTPLKKGEPCAHDRLINTKKDCDEAAIAYKEDLNKIHNERVKELFDNKQITEDEKLAKDTSLGHLFPLEEIDQPQMPGGCTFIIYDNHAYDDSLVLFNKAENAGNNPVGGNIPICRKQ